MNEILQTFQSLHSTHGNLTDTPLPKEHLYAILYASVRVANAGNAQIYAIIVTEDKELMWDVCGYQALVMLIYCINLHRNMDLAEYLGPPYTANTAWVLMTGVAGTSLACQTAVIAAYSLGIDSLISNGVQRGDVRRFWMLLNLSPRNIFPVLALYLGYINRQPESKTGWLTELGIITRGTYQRREKDTLAALVRATDDPAFSSSVWQELRHGHYLEIFFKGPGCRAGTAYAGIAPILEQSGIQIQWVKANEL